MQELPIACSLGAVDYEARRREWRELVAASLRDLERTDTGVRLTFADAPEARRRLGDLVAAERDCCAFATWTIKEDSAALLLLVDSQGEGVGAVQELFAD